MLKRILFSLIFTFIFFIFSSNFALAEEIYVNDFDQKSSDWNYNPGNGQIDFKNGVMDLSSSAYYFPYVEADLSKYLVNSDKIKIKFMFNNVGGMGNGIGIGFTGLGDINYFQFGIWRDSRNGAFFYYHDFNNIDGGFCKNFNGVSDLVGREYFYSVFLDDVWNELEIEKYGTGYRIYINRENNPNPIYTTNQDQCIPNSIWFGNKMAGGSYDWTSLNLDKLIIEGNIKQINKYFIIPGLGASWNTQAMLSPINNNIYEWKMTPFVKNYNNLIKAFEDKGLVKNQDFYVWNYDWRKPIESIVSDFNSYINSLNLSDNTKINIIGHSLGGLIGRIWVQENKSKNLGKIITLGTPNAGAIGAYEVWNGAKIPDNFNLVEKIGLNILLLLQSKNGQKKIDTVHNFVPVLGDILPTFDFAKKNNKIVPSSNLFYKNNYLINKNDSISEIFENLDAVNGYGFLSKEYLNLGERNVYDKVLGYWPDGSIASFSNTSQSDGTVLKKSAVFNNDVEYSISSEHGDLPNNYINGVFNLLGLGNTLSPLVEVNSKNETVFFIGSPAYLDVICDDGVQRKSDEMGFVTIENVNIKTCTVDVVGTNNGIYHLVLGNSSNENSWLYFENEINIGETKKIQYDVENGKLTMSDENKNFLYEQLIDELNFLKMSYQRDTDLNKTIELAQNKQINKLIDPFFKFRKRAKEYVKSDKVLDLIELVLKIENKSITAAEANKAYKKSITDKSLVDRLARLYSVRKINPNEFGSNSYKKMDEKMVLAKNSLNFSKFSDLYSFSIMSSKLSSEVW